MPVVKVEPTDEHPIPYDMSDEKPKTLLEEIAVAGNTAELLVDLGAPLSADEDVAKATKKLKDAVTKGKTKNLNEVSTAFGAAAFLRQYGQQLALDVNQVRAALTFKLMELANYGDPKVELKALELLGKHSDISLFSSKSEITINYKNPEDLENAIKERVKRLMNADVIDMIPLGQSIDEELKHFDHNEADSFSDLSEEGEEADEDDPADAEEEEQTDED